MRFVVHIDCDNAAFEDDPSCEVATLLQKVVRALQKDGSQEGSLRDSNGNRCGSYSYEDIEEEEE